MLLKNIIKKLIPFGSVGREKRKSSMDMAKLWPLTIVGFLVVNAVSVIYHTNFFVAEDAAVEEDGISARRSVGNSAIDERELTAYIELLDKRLGRFSELMEAPLDVEDPSSSAPTDEGEDIKLEAVP